MRLRPLLRRTASVGFAHADGVLDEGFRRALLHEVRAGPFRQMAGTFGKASVRMEIDGYDLAAPFEGFPRVLELAEVVAARVHAEGEGIRGLATWRPNEAGVGLYAPGSLGITSHLDGRWYRRLVIVFTLAGSARFVVRASREGEILEAWDARAGGVTFMRGPGLAGARDGRPFHSVAGPRGAIRCSLAFRMRIGRSQE